jgi:hypothetical protein
MGKVETVHRLLYGASHALRLGVRPWLLILIGASASIAAAQTALIAYDEPVRRWLGRHLRVATASNLRPESRPADFDAGTARAGPAAAPSRPPAAG